MEREQILLAEYKEACDFCRAHEQHTRTALAFYLALSTAILAASYAPAVSATGRVWLGFLGFGVGIFVLNIVLRSRAHYASFVGRARNIEKQLEMSLYTSAWPSAEASGTFSNKVALAAIVGLVALYFLVSSAYWAFTA